MPLLSVVIPVYNAERYLDECINSILNQTLSNIEIICVDDGSKDVSGSMLDEYACQDSRVRVIHKSNTGYGNSMNVGFDAARGKYIGIVESDDWIDPNMFEKLVSTAELLQADVVKSNFWLYYAKPLQKNAFFEVIPINLCGQVFRPLDDVNLGKIDFWNRKPSIWSAIYRTEFIRDNHIRFHETTGASYQDASFNFKVWACADRVFCLDSAFLHYRQDNEASSVNASTSKVYCVRDEYEEMERFIAEYGKDKQLLMHIMNRLRFDTYMWNIDRLASPMKEEFAAYAAETFSKLQKDGGLNPSMFWPQRWRYLQRFVSNYKIAITGSPTKAGVKQKLMDVKCRVENQLRTWTRFYPEKSGEKQ
ncbi:MAG: glycosyltransferase [Clostridia bacterium]|nr:glycosyltransferase [Clostridia bacterium]